jgi:hypothetical protein
VNGGANKGNAREYYESTIQDSKTHNNYIEKIHYFYQIDKVILYEQNMRRVMIYDGLTMNHEKDIACPGVILAIEFIPDKNSICVSLSDRTFLFYDASSTAYKQIKKFVLPSTQKCLCYVQRKRLLFSVGTDGAVFAWLIDKIFLNDFFDESKNEGGDKEDYKYRHFTTENTPWFLGGFGSCIVDLPNLE